MCSSDLKIAVAVLVLTQLMNLALVPWLGHAGLALSIGLAALVNAGWLFVGLRRNGAYTPSPGWGVFALRVLLATVLLGALLAWGAQAVDWIGLRERPWVRIGWVVALLGGSALLYFGALAATGLKLREFVRRG